MFANAAGRARKTIIKPPDPPAGAHNYKTYDNYNYRYHSPVQRRVGWMRAKSDVWSRPVKSGRDAGQGAGQQVGHAHSVRSAGPEVQVQNARLVARPARQVGAGLLRNMETTTFSLRKSKTKTENRPWIVRYVIRLAFTTKVKKKKTTSDDYEDQVRPLANRNGSSLLKRAARVRLRFVPRTVVIRRINEIAGIRNTAILWGPGRQTRVEKPVIQTRE